MISSQTQKKDRVIAIDYFRGVAIILVVINHASLFTWPLTYLTASSLQWSGAAEMFFLLSGITYWIVRGKYVTADFAGLVSRTCRRALLIYIVYLVAVVLSLCLALYYASRGLPIHMPGNLPSATGWQLFWQLTGLRYSLGWANFLMFYSIYLPVAIPAMRLLTTRWWLAMPLISLGVYTAGAYGAFSSSQYASFAVWQVYFFLGLVIGRFRPQILGWYFSRRRQLRRMLAIATVVGAGLILIFSYAVSHPADRAVFYLSAHGWLPDRAYPAYDKFYNYHPALNFLLANSRSGLLRPIAALTMLAGSYVLYQRFKRPIQKYTGSFVNAMGRESLWIFLAQSIVIPLLAIVTISHRRLINDIILTPLLISLMWLLTKRQAIAKQLFKNT